MKTLVCNEMMRGTQSFQMMVFITKRSKIVSNLDKCPLLSDSEIHNNGMT